MLDYEVLTACYSDFLNCAKMLIIHDFVNPEASAVVNNFAEFAAKVMFKQCKPYLEQDYTVWQNYIDDWNSEKPTNGILRRIG